MRSYSEQSFKQILYECYKHKEKISIARQHLVTAMPLTAELYISLNDVDMSFIDQLIFRFSKLQDTLGEKIFPAMLTLSEEDVKRKTFVDILNRLEELDVINKNHWLKLRETRNQIAHEYSFNTEELLESITNVYNASNELINIFDEIIVFCREKFEFLKPTHEGVG